MSQHFRITRLAWMAALLASLGFIAWSDWVRVGRVEYLTGLANDAVVDPASPTGYADGKRWLIVPEHDDATYESIAEAQLMRAEGKWRLRRAPYENAPAGRAVSSASPYHWWLLAVAAVDRALSGRPPGQAIERAALWADPLLHLLFTAAAAIFLARKLGRLEAALMALALAALYPLGAAFVPGVANAFGLTLLWGCGSVLLLLPGLKPGPAAGRWFFSAGVAGGIGLWLGAPQQAFVLEGIALGGILEAMVARRSPASAPPCWRLWAVGGAATSLLAFLLEYFPARPALRLEVNHPLYALAWLGAGELLWRLACAARPGARALKAKDWAIVAAAAIAAGALPWFQARSGTAALLSLGDGPASRLADLPGAAAASSLGAWFRRDGLSAEALATLAGLSLLLPAAWILARRGGARGGLAVAAGCVLAALPPAVLHLRDWNGLDASLAVLIVAGAAALPPGRGRWLWSTLAGVVLCLGLARLWPAPEKTRANVFTTSEAEEFYERGLAHWLRDRAGPAGAVVLAPPVRTPSVDFYGSLRGLGTPDWENRDGLAATLRIVSAGRADEAEALVREHHVDYLVLPSWDSDLDGLARLGLAQPEQSFLFQLHRWTVFDWLCPVPYELPALPGFDGQSVIVYQVTPEVSRATTISRLAEYLIEMHRSDLAAYAERALRSYPSDLGALSAMAQASLANGDQAGFARVFHLIVSNLTVRPDRPMPLDRRVSLAVILALGRRPDLARGQVQLCLEQLDESSLRFLSVDALYHFEVLARSYGLRIADPNLDALAWRLLPEELRERLRARVAGGPAEAAP
ncbi:MAG TPA: hypothetical protein VHV47_04370 [Opitutaceae bacterium]|jgi:hypothetical protein|nr:hypothetical protein [Opitutaceae bacterium]